VKENGLDPRTPVISSRLRVVTWNIWWKFGDWRRREPLIIETLEATEPDIVLLQEVWGHDDIDQAALLGETLGFDHVFLPWRQHEGAGFGNAVLSRWPIVASAQHQYTALDDQGDARSALRADIEGPRGSLQVFTTHLAWRVEESDMRSGQVLELLEFIEAAPPRQYPAILAGDFNAVAESNEIRIATGRHRVDEAAATLRDSWELTNPNEIGWTWHDELPNADSNLEPDRRIDYIFTEGPRPGAAEHVLATSVIEPHRDGDLPASDHSPVLAELRY
jgi:endonuclease/exonuclease/phosphatase family metal-dependent hydrolase